MQRPVLSTVPEPPRLRMIREMVASLTDLYEKEARALAERLRKPPGRVVSIDRIRRYKPAFILLFLALSR